MPEVSVIIPAFNAASTITTALASVEAQTYRDFEIIIVDDGSGDATAEIARRAAPSATIIRQTNGGPAAARNAGIRMAKGRLIGFLDADDLWFPDKLASQVQYFNEYPQAGLVHAPTLILPASAGTATLLSTKRTPGAPEPIFCQLFHIDIVINTLTVVVPKAILLEVGGFDERREVHVEDWDLWLRIAALYPVGGLARAVALHTAGGAMSSAFEKTLLGQRVVIDKNLDLCAVACARHRAAPSSCLNRRLHFLYDELGSMYVQRQRFADARTAFRGASSFRPFALGSRLRYLTCTLDARSVARLHTMKNRASEALSAIKGAGTSSGITSYGRESATPEHSHVVIEAAHGRDTAALELLAKHLRTAPRITVEVRGVLAHPICLIDVLQALRDGRFDSDVAAGSTRHGANVVSDDVLIHASRT